MNKFILKGILVLATFVGSSSFAALAQDGTYTIDPDHSNIGFEVGHLGISFVVGRFDKFAGNVVLASGGTTTVNVNIDVTSINTKVEQRDKHLRSKDFFDVSLFPTAKFTSTAVKYDGEGNPTSIEGDLELHGQKNSVTLTVLPVGSGKDSLGETRVGFHGKTTIKRSNFGMKSLLAVAGDEVTLTLHVEAVKK